VKRIAFAVVAGPLTVVIIWWGGVPLAVLVAAASGVAAWEFYRMAQASGAQPLARLGIVLAALWPLFVALEPRGVFMVPPGVVAGMLLLVLSVAIWQRGPERRPIESVATTLFGIAYTGGLLSFALAIRTHRFVANDAGGTALLLLPVFLTWANDIGAYAAGRLFGERKLLPSVSPGKTIAGAVGGLVASVAVAVLYVGGVLRPAAQLGMRPRDLVLFAVVLSVVGQVGDLAKSLFKREVGVKDSSGLFPGHGGVLDRIDSLLFVLPVAFVLFNVPGFLIPAPTFGGP
jgi:phosphatidate cytidylyltransferase